MPELEPTHSPRERRD